MTAVPSHRWPLLSALPYLAIALASTLYYASYIDVSFNTADEGNYAQIAYELYLGRNPADLAVNYGVLWFQVGAALFRWFGVDYDLVRWTFFGTAILTNLLIYAAIATLTGRRSLAAVASLVPILVPAFPATAFYGLCIMLNVAAQARIAIRPAAKGDWDVALAGAALAVSFQLRPDFGYAFAIPLALALALRRPPRGFAVAAIAFVACLLPGLAAAAAVGFGRELIALYLSYPGLMIEYLTAELFGPAPATIDAASLIQRPPLSDLLTPFALLVYLPVAGIAGFVALHLPALRAGRRDVLAPAIVALSAAAAFPHYFLFRPDMAHLANFMPGYTVLAAVLIVGIAREVGERWRTAAIAAVGMHLAFYALEGYRSPGTGSIGVTTAREHAFRAGNGIDVKVDAGELAALTIMRDTILENSRPGDAIVCLPYCPGVAFMTERRMLLPEFYVDESFLTRRPEWLPAAIEATQTARPPVVIVMDWAINGSEISRFKNWAVPYMSMLDSIAARTVVHSGLTIYLIEPAPA
jgi:hypothetical protein